MTPYLTKQALPALAERHNTIIWVQAALIRAKKLPKFEQFIGRPKEQNQPPVDLEAKMRAMLSGHNERVKNG